jgi:formylglycine-generating enzyme
MTKRNIVTALGLLVTASACSGVLGIDNPTPVVCTNSDTRACSAGQTCEDNQCVPVTSVASPTGGASGVQSTMTGGVTSLSGTSSGTTAGASGGALNSGGSQTGGTSAAATGGVTGSGGAQSGGTSAVATGGVFSSGGTLNGNTTNGGTVATGGAVDMGGSQNGGTSAVATGSTDNGGTSSTETTTTGGSIGSGGTSSTTGGDTTVTTGGNSTGGAAVDSGGLATAVQTALGGQTASNGGSAGGLSSGGSMSGRTSSCTGTTGDSGTGGCVPGTHRCHVPENAAGNPVYWQTCGTDCSWTSGTYCNQYCTTASGCQTAPSCASQAPSLENLSYCASTPIDGGTFNRSPVSDADGNQYCTSDNPCPATVGPFSLDIYEATVGRFRNFVEHYSQNMITQGSGKNPKIPTDSGWDTSWNALMPADSTALAQALKSCSGSTYTDNSGGHDYFPVGCVNWYLAFAFCIWDGGRLPTEVEWYYAASGGQDRDFPWSNPPDNPLITTEYAVYTPSTQLDTLTSPENVGSVPKGIARWGQYDMAGNILEWLADAHADLYVDTNPCIDCANLVWTSALRLNRGGAYLYDETYAVNSIRMGASAIAPKTWVGFRCARDP